MRYDLIVFLVAIISQAAWFIFSLSDQLPVTTALSTISLSVLILSFCGYWLISSNQANSILRELRSRLPTVSIISGQKRIFEELRFEAERADTYIHATGSAARDLEFLTAINAAVNERGVTYVRILYRRHVNDQLKVHLRTLLEHQDVSVLRLNEDHYGYYFITEKSALLVVPNILDSSMLLFKFDDIERSEAIRNAFTKLLANANLLGSQQELELTFEEFSDFGI